MKGGFQRWLESKDCYAILHSCLEGAHRKLKRPDWLADSGDPDDILDEVAVFWEFLKGQDGSSLVALEALVGRQDWEGLRRKIVYMYGLYKREKSRDPLYQRVRQVLHAAGEEIGYQAGRKYSWYGANFESAPTCESYKELVAFGMKPFHPQINASSINSKEVILVLAKSFKEQVEQELGSDCRIPIRELCSFIREGYDVDIVYPTPGKVAEPLEYETRDEDEEVRIKNDGILDWPYSEAILIELSRVLIYRIEQQNLILLFCLVRYCQLKQKDVAKALGYSGPSGIHAPLAKLDALIREFFSLHDGLSAPDANEALLQFFGKLLLDSCNDDDCSRYA